MNINQVLQAFKNRFNSDRADNNTISQMLWIVIAVVIVLAVGGLIMKTISQKGGEIATKIEDSDANFQKMAEDAIEAGRKGNP